MSETAPSAAADPDPPGFRAIADLVAEHARAAPGATAIIDAAGTLDYAALDALADRVAAALQRDGIAPGEAVAVCAANCARYVAVFLGALRAGAALAPLALASAAATFDAMRRDSGARLLFVDAQGAALLAARAAAPALVALDEGAPGQRFEDWLEPAGVKPRRVAIRPGMAFDIIYSSGTTGAPKGIVQPHAMRWAHVMRGASLGYGPEAVTMIATPLYSNTTLVSLFPSLAFGGCVVLMDKFDVLRYLALAQRHRATHAMLVPVQYQRLMAHPRFAEFDLRSFRIKFCTSAPFAAALKADILARWPGGLVEYYGMTEGGGSCALLAHEHPDKLHTVGRPLPGHDIRLIDEDGRELPAGATGEVVGRSGAMMSGYHRQPGLTAEAEWFDAEGRRYIRTGDLGRFDAEGFLTLQGRRKDMIISGGFNVYPGDLEAVLQEHPAVAEAAVVGAPSAQWGETPIAWVVVREGQAIDAESLRRWANARLGKTQRIAALHFIAALPRSAIGKVLKTALRERHPP